MEVDVEPDRQHLGGESNGFSLKRRPDCEWMLSGSPACIINPGGSDREKYDTPDWEEEMGKIFNQKINEFSRFAIKME